MPDDAPLAGQHREYVLGHVLQALSEDPRAADMDVQVRIAEERVVLEGCASTEQHRGALATVVAELLPGWTIDNRVRVRRWAAPHGAEAI